MKIHNILACSAMAAIVMNIPSEAATKQEAALQTVQQYVNLIQYGINVAHQGVQSGNIQLATALLNRCANQLEALTNHIQSCNYSNEFAECFITNSALIEQLKQARAQTMPVVTAGTGYMNNEMARLSFNFAWAGFEGQAAAFESIAYSLYGRG